jgi:hypothetical protein
MLNILVLVKLKNYKINRLTKGGYNGLPFNLISYIYFTLIEHFKDEQRQYLFKKLLMLKPRVPLNEIQFLSLNINGLKYNSDEFNFPIKIILYDKKMF